MTMQRRHFELIAESVKYTLDGTGNPDARHALGSVAYNLASRLASTNPNFNRARFLRACGVEE